MCALFRVAQGPSLVPSHLVGEEEIVWYPLFVHELKGKSGPIVIIIHLFVQL